MSTIAFKLVTPERVALEQQVEQISLPTPKGEITILPHHVALVAGLTAGEVRIQQGGKTIPLVISGGIVKIADNVVTVLAQTAEHATEIDEQRAEQAQQRALERLRSVQEGDDVNYAAMSSKIEKEMARVRVARKHKHGRTQPSIDSSN
jgi:F-type H+-transporting ATPase subunit epsilon